MDGTELALLANRLLLRVCQSMPVDRLLHEFISLSDSVKFQGMSAQFTV